MLTIEQLAKASYSPRLFLLFLIHMFPVVLIPILPVFLIPMFPVFMIPMFPVFPVFLIPMQSGVPWENPDNKFNYPAFLYFQICA